MHQARPYGLFGAEVNGEDAKAVEALARNLTNIKTLAGVDSLKMTRALPGGGMATAVDMGGVFRIIVQPALQPPQEPLPSDGLAKSYVPMLFSGVVTSAIVQGGQGVRLDVSRDTRRRLGGYDPKEVDKQASSHSLQRFVIPYGERFQEFLPETPGPYTYTQYAQLRPTWYSGAMAEVVQIVGGYGRQDFDKLPDLPVERARLPIPQKVADAIQQEMGNTRLPGYIGLPPKDGAIRFDYKYSECHCIGFDSEKRPWLLRLSQSGVYAMPLPLIPATTTKAFGRWVREDAQDEEIAWILERFGGMPSGESFPGREADFEAWRRAGVIIKVCDASDYWQHLAYSTACGWSMNASGTEGYNTCYDYDEDEGLAYGLTYKLQLQLQPAQFDGKLPQGFDVGSELEQNQLNGYLAGLSRRAKTKGHEQLALKYKLRRIPVAELLARAEQAAKTGNYQAEYDYWNNREQAPIASHSGVIARTNKGWLHNPAPFKSQPQIKFAEPLQQGCVSFDFLPLVNGVGKNPRCDTIMYVYHVGDEVKAVKYFRDVREFQRMAVNDFDECMTVGSWEETVYHGPSRILGHFYTADFDGRETVAESTTVRSIVGVDKGYDTVPFFEFDAPFWRPGTLFRNRYFTHKSRTTTSAHRSIDLAVCIPYLSRGAALYAQKDETVSQTITDELDLYQIRDPYSYRYWTYDPVMHWAGSLEVMRGVPYPVNGNPVWVEIENYHPSACSDFADTGPWVPGLPADYTWLIHPQANVWRMSGGGGPPPVKEYVTTTGPDTVEKRSLDVSVQEQARSLDGKVDNLYFLPSPSEMGEIFYRDIAKVVAGAAIYANVSEGDPQAPGRRQRFGFTRLADHRSAHHFLGVINE